LVGGVDKKNRPENNFTDKQFKSLKSLLRFYRVKYQKAMILGHNELDPYKACPSFNVQEWLKMEGIS
jgi:N-acetyl-anhydromuramyl-L-alanine amidase AmpD